MRDRRPAAAATPCWKALLNDWYDGRIDNTYALHCYTDALKHLPPDVQTYSSAHDDIVRALQSAKAKLGKEGKAITPNTPSAGEHDGGNADDADRREADDDRRRTSSGDDRRQRDEHRPQAGRPPSVANKLNPSAPSRCRVPLLVLGGLALLLVAAGAGGLVAKRFQRRRAGSRAPRGNVRYNIAF